MILKCLAPILSEEVSSGSGKARNTATGETGEVAERMRMFEGKRYQQCKKKKRKVPNIESH